MVAPLDTGLDRQGRTDSVHRHHHTYSISLCIVLLFSCSMCLGSWQPVHQKQYRLHASIQSDDTLGCEGMARTSGSLPPLSEVYTYRLSLR
jgi:hypothetical protein